MIIHSNIKSNIQDELLQSKSVWIASAMISYSGWKFLQKHISKSTLQHYLIGIDLATDPKVFETIFLNTDINARVYETKYTFHPKVYLVQRLDDSFTAFIGSSNTTSWGLEKNVEMNFQINDQNECKKLLKWFNDLYTGGYLITQKFIDDYKLKFVRTSIKSKEIEKEVELIKADLTIDKKQFFTNNDHEIFNKKYHYVNSEDLQKIRREVRDRFLKLHNSIYSKFSSYGLNDLHCHHQSREIVSRHFFNQYSGNYINAMWLHYGKSSAQLQAYSNADKSINKPDSFINNVRMQVIIHDDSVGIWLVLGRSNGSEIDRKHFRNQIKDPVILKKVFDACKKLGNEYWINVPNAPALKDIKTATDFGKVIDKEQLEDYFIIGCDIDKQDLRLSKNKISNTVLREFQKLYPIYEIMRHQ